MCVNVRNIADKPHPSTQPPTASLPRLLLVSLDNLIAYFTASSPSSQMLTEQDAVTLTAQELMSDVDGGVDNVSEIWQ